MVPLKTIGLIRVQSCLLLVAISACASIDQLAYPGGWPTRSQTQGCSKLTGVFENTPTRHEATRHLDPYNVLLSGVIINRIPLSSLPIKRGPYVSIDAELLTIRWCSASGCNSDEVSLRPDWNCSAQGILTTEYSVAAESENSIVAGKQRVTVSISHADDESILLHEVIESSGGWPDPKSRDEGWATFKRIR